MGTGRLGCVRAPVSGVPAPPLPSVAAAVRRAGSPHPRGRGGPAQAAGPQARGSQCLLPGLQLGTGVTSEHLRLQIPITTPSQKGHTCPSPTGPRRTPSQDSCVSVLGSAIYNGLEIDTTQGPSRRRHRKDTWPTRGWSVILGGGGEARGRRRALETPRSGERSQGKVHVL